LLQRAAPPATQSALVVRHQDRRPDVLADLFPVRYKRAGATRPDPRPLSPEHDLIILRPRDHGIHLLAGARGDLDEAILKVLLAPSRELGEEEGGPPGGERHDESIHQDPRQGGRFAMNGISRPSAPRQALGVLLRSPPLLPSLRMSWNGKVVWITGASSGIG